MAVQSQRVAGKIAEKISPVYKASNNDFKAYYPRAERMVAQDRRYSGTCVTIILPP